MKHDLAHDFEIISPFLDGALSEPERRTFLLRLEQESDLVAQVEAERGFRIGFRTTLSREKAPAVLRDRISAMIAEANHAPVPTMPEPDALSSRWWQRLWGGAWLRSAWWMSPKSMSPIFAAALTLTMVVVVGGFSWVATHPQPDEDHSVVHQIAGRHRVYFGGDLHQPALDIIGNQKEVLAWFGSRFPFHVNRLPVLPGWQIVGARLGEYHHRSTLSALYIPVEDQVIASDLLPREHLSLTLFYPQPEDFPEKAHRSLQGKSYFIGLDEGNPVILWRDNDTDPSVGYALVGEPGRTLDDLLHLAAAMRTGP